MVFWVYITPVCRKHWYMKRLMIWMSRCDLQRGQTHEHWYSTLLHELPEILGCGILLTQRHWKSKKALVHNNNNNNNYVYLLMCPY